MRIEHKLINDIRTKGLISCDEVTSYYGYRADVLALNVSQKIIVEYEFKRSSSDLKRNELSKNKYDDAHTYRLNGIERNELKTKKWLLKYRKEKLKPHKFYFVIPESLYQKELTYLLSLDKHTGVLVYPDDESGVFVVKKRCIQRMSGLQKFEVVLRYMVNRSTSAYLNSLNNLREQNENKTL